jgi:hypothetical protein
MQTVHERQEVVVRHATNRLVEVEYKLSTNAAQLAQDAGTVTNAFFPGLGSVVSAAGTGLLAVFGHFWRKRRLITQLEGEADERVEEEKMGAANAAKALTETIENYRDVVLALPNGAAADAHLMNQAMKLQQQLGAGALVLEVVKNHIKNPDVQEASAKLAEEARRLAGLTPPK